MNNSRVIKIDDYDYLLIAEGKTDLHVIASLCNVSSFPINFYIDGSSSKDEAKNKFAAHLISSIPKRRIALVLDCDHEKKPDAIVDFFMDRLEYNGIIDSITERYEDNGIIFHNNGDIERIGLWIMPDNVNVGCIEDMLINAFDVEVRKYIDNILNEAKSKSIATYKDIHHSKAVIHSYLAWQNEPGYPIGLSIKAKVLTTACANVSNFVTWVKMMYGE